MKKLLSRTTLTKLLFLALLGIFALSLTGCSSSSSDDIISHDVPDDEDTDSDIQYSVITPRDDLTNEALIEWESEGSDNDNDILIKFSLGSPSCYGARYVVEETDDSVAIAVISGTLPDAPEVCTEEAYLAAFTIPLNSPLGERTITMLDTSKLNLH